MKKQNSRKGKFLYFYLKNEREKNGVFRYLLQMLTNIKVVKCGRTCVVYPHCAHILEVFLHAHVRPHIAHVLARTHLCNSPLAYQCPLHLSILLPQNQSLKGVFSKPSGKMIVVPNYCFLS
jgi:hypothetical protein